jgi:hypothetical protein
MRQIIVGKRNPLIVSNEQKKSFREQAIIALEKAKEIERRKLAEKQKSEAENNTTDDDDDDAQGD